MMDFGTGFYMTRENEIWLDCDLCGASDSIPIDGAEPYKCVECGALMPSEPDLDLLAHDPEVPR